jgi:hypothetical protein
MKIVLTWLISFAIFAALTGCGPTTSEEPPEQGFSLAEIEGLTTDHASTGGVGWADYDGDGDLDLLVTNGYDVSADEPTGQQDRLYRNDGDGAWTDVSAEALPTDDHISSGHTWGDYDNDGDLDVFITTQQDQDNLLYRNDDGKFTAVDDQPMTTGGGHTYAAAWVDVDGDGWLDLFVANGGMSHAGANRLFRGVGEGRFEEITEGEIVTEVASTCGVAWGDCDNDGDPDLFVANYGFAPPANHNALYLNDGNWTFTRVTETPVVEDGAPSCAATWVDVDGDLDLDLHVTNMFGMADLLYLNDGKGNLTPGPFSSLNLDAGHTYGANWGDYDNDGDLDAVAASWGAAAVFYRNDGTGIFTRSSGGDLGSRIEFPGALATGDADGDGHLDVYLGNWPNNPGDGEPNRLFLNTGTAGHWLQFSLKNAQGGIGGIGARVTVTTSKGMMMQEITAQHGFRGQSDLRPHFGLGDARSADRVEVRWPSGRVSVLTDVAADQVLEVVEPGS